MICLKKINMGMTKTQTIQVIEKIQFQVNTSNNEDEASVGEKPQICSVCNSLSCTTMYLSNGFYPEKVLKIIERMSNSKLLNEISCHYLFLSYNLQPPRRWQLFMLFGYSISLVFPISFNYPILSC